MLQRLTTILFFVIPVFCCAQTNGVSSFSNTINDKAQSISHPTLPTDSLTIGVSSKLDSLQLTAGAEYASLKYSYDSISSGVDNQINRMNHSIDSLQQLQLPTEHLTHKADSLQQWRNEKLASITSKVDKLKSGVKEKVNGLDLPPELQSKASKLTGLMDKLDVKLPSTDLPLSFQNKLDLSGLNNPLGDLNSLNGLDLEGINSANIPGVDNLNLPSTDLNRVTSSLSEYQQQLGQLPTDVENAGKLAEQQVTKLEPLADVQGELGQVGELTGKSTALQDPEAMKQELLQQAQQQAVNHFAGKEEQLQQAMATLAKYKRKYASLNSLSEIPKKRPNEMRNKPFVERLTPGLALQIFRKDIWMVDFNPYVGYRFNTRLTVGLGWNQRVAYDHHVNQFNPDARVYGPRAYGEFKIGKGFSGHLNIEYINTFVPPQFSSGNVDGHGREWVFSTMAGMKKEYRITKNLKGTAYVLYNLYDPRHRSPYGDKLNMRLGVEMALRKKPHKR